MASPGTDREALVRVLIVCTANRCRSPLAAALLDAALTRRGQTVEVLTAGLGAPGLAATDETILVAARHDLDLTDHRSRGIDRALVARADVVLAMERRHVREVVVDDPSAWPRTFTLKELVRRGTAIGPRPDDESLPAWLARAHEGRTHRDLLGASPLDDVDDPSGAPLGDHEDLARELEELVGRIADLIVRSRPPPIRWSSA